MSVCIRASDAPLPELWLARISAPWRHLHQAQHAGVPVLPTWWLCGETGKVATADLCRALSTVMTSQGEGAVVHWLVHAANTAGPDGVVPAPVPATALVEAVEAWLTQHAAMAQGTPTWVLALQRLPSGWAEATWRVGEALSRQAGSGAPGLDGSVRQRAPWQAAHQGQASGLSRAAAVGPATSAPLEAAAPALFAALRRQVQRLERHWRDAVSVPFVACDDALYVQGVAPAPRTPAASVRLAVDLQREGLLDVCEALGRLDAASLPALVQTSLPPAQELARCAGLRWLTRGVAANPGGAVGLLAFDEASVAAALAAGRPAVLACDALRAQDVPLLRQVHAVVSTTGGLTSHTAVMARALGKCCIVGCSALQLRRGPGGLQLRVCEGSDVQNFEAGTLLSVDGRRGHLYAGEAPVHAAMAVPALESVLAWAADHAACTVLANVDDANAATRARALGAQGVGLCRSDLLCFGQSGLPSWLLPLLALDGPLPAPLQQQVGAAWQRAWHALLHAMAGLPVAVRLLDGPLGDWLPQASVAWAAAADTAGMSPAALQARVERVRQGPLARLRGARLALCLPALYELQLTALLAAWRAVDGAGPLCILLPAVDDGAQLQALLAHLRAVAEVQAPAGLRPAPLRWGAMVEVPRACHVADALASQVDRLAFGSNDLTAHFWGLSRDVPLGLDAASPPWQDPFRHFDAAGVGALIAGACARARARKADIHLSLCGEHAGDPAAIALAQQWGMHSLSCTPDRLIALRVAAAQHSVTPRPDRPRTVPPL